MSHTAHLLRPAFTRILAKNLHNGAVINLVGTEANGSLRLLDDLMGMEIKDFRMLQVDMREFADHDMKFVVGISQAMGFLEHAQEFDEWVDAMQLHGGKLCLMLNHFDAIERGDESGYNDAFFAAINRFHLIPNLSLLVVTKKPIEARLTSVEDFLAQGDFEPEVLKLPPLGYKRYQEELTRKFPEWKPDLAIVTPIFSHPLPYPFLEYVIQRLESLGQTNPEITLEVMADWRAQFDKENGVETAEVIGEKKPWWKFW